jgi:glycosyltransferase involved in cell wall biosynthesis
MTQPRFRVVLISPRFFPVVGGGENQARLVAGMLTRVGHDVTVLASRTHVSPWREVMEGFTVVRLPSFRFRGIRGIRALAEQALFLLAAVPVLLARLRRFDILFFFWGIDYFSMLAGPMRLLGKRSVIRTASTFSREIGNLRSARGAGIRLRMIHVFDAFLALSAEIAARYVRDGVPADRIIRVRNAVDLGRFAPATEEERSGLRALLGISPHRKAVLYCGHLTAVKGIDLLLRSLEGLSEPIHDAELIVLGSAEHSGEAPSEWVREAAERVRGKIPVRLVGQVDDVAPFFRCADILVLPSRMEGMPNVLLEAMASGLACVATSVGAVPDILDDGADGLVVPAEDEAALRAAILRVVLDDRLRVDLGAAARSKAVSRFGHHALVSQYEEIFARVLKRE